MRYPLFLCCFVLQSSIFFFYGENKKGYVIKTYPFLYLNRGLIKLSSP